MNDTIKLLEALGQNALLSEEEAQTKHINQACLAQASQSALLINDREALLASEALSNNIKCVIIVTPDDEDGDDDQQEKALRA